MTNSAPPGKTLPALLLELGIRLVLLVVPFVLPVFLPLSLAIAYWVATLAAEWVENRLAGKVDRTFIWVFGGAVGISVAAVRPVPGIVVAVIAGVALFLCLLLIHKGWEKLAGLRIDRAPAGPRLTEVERAPSTGPSAWSTPAPVTPEGEAVRVLSCGEIAMGGPVVCDYLFADGSVVMGGGASTGFSPDGRYFVTPAPSRENWGLLIFDRRRRILHRCSQANMFWEIDLVGEMTVTGRYSPLTSDRSHMALIDDLIAHSSRERLIEVGDLGIPETDWNVIRARQQVSLAQPPAGGPKIAVVLELPASLKALEAPLDPLYSPRGELFVDDAPSGLLISMTSPQLVWRSDAQACVCEVAPRKDAGRSGDWLWEAGRGWREIPAGLDLRSDWPPATRKLGALDTSCLVVEWTLSQPRLGYDGFGPISSYTHAPLEIGGRRYPQPEVRQLLPLAKESAATERLESAPLNGGKRLVWRFLRFDAELSCRVYACAFDGRALDGEWLLDHRISTDGGFAAVVAYAPPPLVPHRIAIIDAASGAVTMLEEDGLCDPHLQGFSDGVLYFVRLAGRHYDQPHHAPGREPDRIDEHLPSLAKARTFMMYRAGSHLTYHQVCAVRCDNGWRIAGSSAPP